MPYVRVRCSFALIMMHGVLRKGADVAWLVSERSRVQNQGLQTLLLPISL